MRENKIIKYKVRGRSRKKIKNDRQTQFWPLSYGSQADVLPWRWITPLFREFTTATGNSKFQ